MGTAMDFTAKPDPAMDTPETVNDFVPVFVMVKDCVELSPMVSEPKPIVEGLTSMDKPVVAPVVPGLPVTPTQPEVTSIPVRMRMVAATCKSVGKERLRGRRRALTSAPSRMGVSFITNAV
jgi:hypothetical protein